MTALHGWLVQVPGNITDMSKYTNRALVMIEDLSTINTDSKGEVRKVRGGTANARPPWETP